ncbi:uncharacterized protein [Drosophila virilis]|uniref:uncharacterized protein isoform X1 n=1 Tax=Drosophila virilis TaxID=7244 RepID=UPI0038B2A700
MRSLGFLCSLQRRLWTLECLRRLRTLWRLWMWTMRRLWAPGVWSVWSSLLALWLIYVLSFGKKLGGATATPDTFRNKIGIDAYLCPGLQAVLCGKAANQPARTPAWTPRHQRGRKMFFVRLNCSP